MSPPGFRDECRYGSRAGQGTPPFPSRYNYTPRVYATRIEPQGGGALEGQHARQPCPDTVTAQSAGKRRKKETEKKIFSFFCWTSSSSGGRQCWTLCSSDPRMRLSICRAYYYFHAQRAKTRLRPLQLTWSKGALNHIYTGNA